ncbi:MAG TPA: hypothetical protein VF705_05585 [Longimicrobium sp.]
MNGISHRGTETQREAEAEIPSVPGACSDVVYSGIATARGEELMEEARKVGVSPEELDAERVATVFEKLVARLSVWNQGHSEDLAGLPVPGAGLAMRRSAMGRYAHVAGTSDDFAAEKRDEIDREERKRA